MADAEVSVTADGDIATFEGDRNAEGEMHGQGARTNENGDVYVGAFKHDRYGGHGTYTSFSNKADEEEYAFTYEGNFENDQMNGEGKLVYGNGNVYEGWFKNGQFDKHGVFAWHAKQLKGNVYTGEYKDNKRHGHGALTYANGNRYEGRWDNNKRIETGTLTYANGDHFKGSWENDAMTRGTFTWENGNVYVGEMKENKRHGKGAMTRTNGVVESGKWVANKFVPSWLLCPDCKTLGVAMCADCVYTDD